MKKTYRIISLGLATVTLLAMLASCDSGDTPDTEDTQTQEQSATESADTSLDSTQATDTQKQDEPTDPKMIMLSGNKISDYSIYVPEGEPTVVTARAKVLKQKIKDITGANIPILNKKTDLYIQIKCGLGIDVREGKVYFDGDNLIIQGGSVKPFSDIISKFTSSLKAGAKYKEDYKILTKDVTTKMNGYFDGTCEKDALTYKLNEEIKFNISLYNKDGEIIGCPKFSYTITGDDGQKISDTVDGTSGTLTLTTKLTKAGFVRVVVKAVELDGKTAIEGFDTYEGGAGADLKNVTQSLAEPSDFDEFWEAQIQRLPSFTLGDVKLTEIATDKSNFVAYDVEIPCVDGSKPATGVLTMPKNASAGSLSAEIQFYGYGHNVAAEPVFKTGTIVINVNSHGLKNTGMPDSYYTDYQAEITKDGKKFGFYTEDNKNPETCYFLNMHLRNIQLARYILAMPEYNGKGIVMSAGSMGAMQAIALAANIGNNAKQLKIMYPWLSDIGGKSTGKVASIFQPETVDADGNVIAEGLLYFDSVNFAKRVSCPVTLGARLGDYTCPPSGMVVIYKAFASNDKSLEFRQNATHGYVSPVKIVYNIEW